ncbi:MAG: class I SAM-dependent methyltransferase [Elusimicrobiales bacterium]|nr:class I SAM-dependent methyltransferase [Elusimicrobiales bacterium]
MASIKDERGYNQGFAPTKTWEIRTRRRAARIASLIAPADKTVSVLEIGCGTGYTAYLLARNTRAAVLGTDRCALFINEAAGKYKLPNLSYKVVDLLDPKELAGSKFDYVVGDGILHHMYFDMDNTLGKIYSLLKPDGKIAFLEPNLVNPMCALIFKVGWFRKKFCIEPGESAFSRRYITAKLKTAGFQNVAVNYVDFLLPCLPLQLAPAAIFIGDILERAPLLDKTSQSLLISASKPGG